jgi:hypothetical protein
VTEAAIGIEIEAAIGIEIEAAIGTCTGLLERIRILECIRIQGLTPIQESIQTTVAVTAVVTAVVMDVMAEVRTAAMSRGAIETV